ncbi:hypothetical protein J6590_058763 [Homalodisca vitripennis]|nr:hypothetical protein J6590_058763 [Homalodisca vitripennis]
MFVYLHEFIDPQFTVSQASGSEDQEAEVLRGGRVAYTGRARWWVEEGSINPYDVRAQRPEIPGRGTLELRILRRQQNRIIQNVAISLSHCIFSIRT